MFLLDFISWLQLYKHDFKFCQQNFKFCRQDLKFCRQNLKSLQTNKIQGF